jgi:small subunit ribosomal protein S13
MLRCISRLRTAVLPGNPLPHACRVHLSDAASPRADLPAEKNGSLAAFAAMRRVLKLPVGTMAVIRAPPKRGSAPVRVESFSLPPQRGALYGLRAIFGVGRFQASRLCAKAFLSERLQVAQFSNTDIERLSAALKEMVSDEANADAPSYLRFEYGDRLRRRIGEDIKKLKTSGTYRGVRHTRGLPLRGQRTKSNAQTSRRRPKYDA